MLLILISWIYITITTITFGVLLSKILRLNVRDFAINSILGLFGVTLITSAWAAFGRVNWEFHSVLLAVNAFAIVKFREPITTTYKLLWEQLTTLPTALKLILGSISVLILAQCASIPYVIDNESYYIQTIKWINEYGFVKGVANIHFFLAQTSGWHVTQSAFNFSFLYGSFNDLSGYCLLLGNLFAITRLAAYFENGKKLFLVIGLLPLANILLFQFISAPSPDIPVYILSFMIFFYFIERYRNMDMETFTLIVLLALFALYVKTTAIALVVLPLVVLIKNFRIVLLAIWKCALCSLAVLVLFVTKNTIVSGHPFFPITGYQFVSNDYSLPDSVANLYYSFTRLCAFFVTQEQYDAMSVTQKFVRWITLPKLHGVFNKLITALVIITPALIYWLYNKREIWLLYLTMCIELAFLSLSSPQYRFFLNFILFFSFFITALVITKKKLIIGAMALSVFISAFVLLVTINLNRFTNNKFVMESSTFSFNNVIYPYKNTKYDNGYKVITNGNLRYYSPVGLDFFWASGDGPLPCVNQKQIRRFYRKNKILPQMRTDNIADGFYAKDVTKQER